MKQLVTALAILLIISLFPNTSNAAVYRDVPTNHWAHAHILKLSNMGAISGFADGNFRPDVNVTRGQAAKIITAGSGIPERTRGTLPFTDVPASHPMYLYVESLVVKGGISGFSDNTYRPNAIMKRSEMAKVIAEAFDLEATSAQTFKDVAASEWYAPYVAKLAAAGITSGFPDGTYRPNQLITRVELAAMVGRALQETTTAPALPTGTLSAQQVAAYQKELLAAHNAERAKVGAPPLALDPTLNKLAQQKAVDMYTYDYFDHYSARLGRWFDQLQAAGYTYRTAGENIADWSPDAQSVTQGWVDSPGHYRNMVNPCYNKVGFGVYGKTTNSNLYFVAGFTGTSSCN